MDGLVLLYAITFIPVSGVYGSAIDQARKAALVQSGVEANWRQASAALERRVPPTILRAAAVGAAIKQRQLILQYRPVTVTASPGSARAVFSWGF